MKIKFSLNVGAGLLVGATLMFSVGTTDISSLAAAEGDAPKDDLIPGDFSANVALTTDYTFRGISQTSEIPAIQGGLDYDLSFSDAIGFNLGAWGSNVNFNDEDQAQVEIDYYGGFSGKLSDIDWSAGVIYYSYPGAAGSLSYDYLESTIGLEYAFTDWLSASVGYNYSPDYFGDSGPFHYPNGGLTLSGPGRFSPTLTATAGYSAIQDNTAWGTPNYWDWSVGASVTVEGFDLGVTYVDTNLSKTECGSENCKSRGVFTVSRSF